MRLPVCALVLIVTSGSPAWAAPAPDQGWVYDFQLFEGERPIDDVRFLRQVERVAPHLTRRRSAYDAAGLAHGLGEVGRYGVVAGAVVVGAALSTKGIGLLLGGQPGTINEVVAVGGYGYHVGAAVAEVGAGLWLGGVLGEAGFWPRPRPFNVAEATRAAKKYNLLHPKAAPLRVMRPAPARAEGR